ncbi:MAG: hypothetical protein LAT51_07020 [Flavobacteriaceae bacterium]|nr:hypothetical protein [Flavobacteriaceae bacterium]
MGPKLQTSYSINQTLDSIRLKLESPKLQTSFSISFGQQTYAMRSL